MELAKVVVPARDKVGLNTPNLADGGPSLRPGALPFEEEPFRCAAAHSDDVRQCEGQRNAVQIIDRTGASVAGCVLHGAVLLASLEGGRVAPLNGPDGAAIEAFRRAQVVPPFDFLGSRGVAVTVTTAVDPTDSSNVRRAQMVPPFDFLGSRGVAVTATTAVDPTDSSTLGTNSGVAMDACSCWSGTGNARSSCSKEIMESRSREIA